MFLEIEGHKIVNLDLVEVVEMNHRAKIATAWNGGVNIVSDSRILWRYFAKEAKVTVLPPEEEIQPGQAAA